MAQSALKTCEICVSAPGSSCSCYCLDCEQCFCENCKVLHSRQKISANHEFKETSDFIPYVKSKCTDHNEAFTFVCLACDVSVCVCCVTEKHNGHKLSKLKDTIAQLKSKIEQNVSTKLNKTSGNVSKLEKNISLFNDTIETAIKLIAEEGNNIKFMVDQYTAKRIASIQEQARRESNRLSAILSDHKTAFKKACDLDNSKRNLVEESRHDGTLIEMLKSLNRDIDKLGVCPLPVFPLATFTPKVVKEKDILRLLGTCEIFETTIERDKKNKSIPPPPPMTRNLYFTCSICGRQERKGSYNIGEKNHMLSVRNGKTVLKLFR